MFAGDFVNASGFIFHDFRVQKWDFFSQRGKMQKLQPLIKYFES
jgi:hypothetical protein